MKSNNCMQQGVIFHIDVNSAYLAWESLERRRTGELFTVGGGDESSINRRVIPDLRDIISVIGGDAATRRGIVLSKSIHCKPYNIQTGESLYSALQKCPALVVVPARFGVYEKYSEDMIEYLHNFSDRVQQYSIDEAFLDYTHMERHFGPPLVAADAIRNGVKERFGFTVSVGVGPNKLLAKMATELRKPDFTNTLLFPGEIEKMWALPIEELFMAGRATAPKLRRLGIQTIGDLAHFDVQYLRPTFKSAAQTLWEYANGIDDSVVEPYHGVPKSIGHSTTIPHDVKRYDDANRVLLHLCESVGKRLRQKEMLASVVSIGIRNSLFEFYSHQGKCTPTDHTTTLYNHAKQLFREAWKREPIRQLGVRVEKLSDSRMGQLSLFGQEIIDKQQRLDTAIDGIRARFGDAAVMRAGFLCTEKKDGHTLDKFSPFKATGGL